MLRFAVLLLAVLWLLTGCTTKDLQHGMYEGLRVRNDLQSAPSERIGRPDSPSYQEYERLKKQQGN